jgi:hypothetical protein
MHRTRSRRLSAAITAASTALILMVALAPSALASTPSSGSVGPASGSHTAWNFAPVGPGVSSGGTIESACVPTICDPYTLTVHLPSADGTFYAHHAARLHLVYTWTSTQPNDMDVFAFAPDGTESGPGSPDDASTGPGKEVLDIANPASGNWVIESHVGITPAATPAQATATFTYTTLSTPAPKPGVGGGPAFSDASPNVHYQSKDVLARQNAGEPSIGADWTTGRTLYMAGTQVSRITYDSSRTPPKANWADVTPTQQQQVNEDAILFTDRQTGRTWALGLLVAGSSISFSDDDGKTWTQGTSPVPHGPDHETLGAGPFHAPKPSGASYSRAVYYCSQNILQLAGAFCARSDDGGQTWNPGVKVFGTGTPCGAIHGHVKVDNAGTVYVPQLNCSQSGGGSGQGMAISTDNGQTWKYSVVPDSTARASNTGTDPSIGIGAKNSVYFGYEDGSGHPKIAVSHDQGKTWSKSVDVGVPFGIQNSKFPEVVAGDDDRAAFAFLGTDSAGDDQADAFRGTWYVYVALTYDGGLHWTTYNAAPGNPVQRGCIWNGGGSNACRNLLDFNDVTVDKAGRVLIGYTDGCKDINFSYASTAGEAEGAIHGPSKCNSKPNSFKDTDKVSFDGLARQSCGQGLFAGHHSFTDFCPPPRIINVNPPNNTKNASRTTTVTATFDEIVTSERLRLTSPTGASVAGTLRCDSPCATVTFVPSAPLKRDKTYSAVVTGTNSAGTARYTWSFHTAP